MIESEWGLKNEQVRVKIERSLWVHGLAQSHLKLVWTWIWNHGLSLSIMVAQSGQFRFMSLEPDPIQYAYEPRALSLEQYASNPIQSIHTHWSLLLELRFTSDTGFDALPVESDSRLIDEARWIGHWIGLEAHEPELAWLPPYSIADECPCIENF